MNLPNCILSALIIAFIPLASCSSADFSSKTAGGQIPVLEAQPQAARRDINGRLPKQVYVTTLTQTFARDMEFCISSGKIMAKKRTDDTWNLFLKTGLPFSRKPQIPGAGWFQSPDCITEIAADDDMLLAFDNYGRMYICPIASNKFDKKNEWSAGFGWPDKKQLVQNNLVSGKRGWATGTRRGSIQWYTDRFGNEHHWGTMGVTTVYFLSQNGQEIRFTDSGLPADFSKTILCPDRGSFIAENISASGSTVFLIDKSGTMYTRLIDYDTMGCDPMFFKYTYKAEKQPYKGSDYRSNFTRWGLPNEDWSRQPPVPVWGKAQITKDICIFQDGKGNDARMLRVAGLSPDGTPGFYWKTLKGERWQFEKAPLHIPEEDFLPASSRDRDIRGNKNEYSYSGFILKDDQALNGITCSISDMTLTSEGSCTMQIAKGNEKKDIPFYLVEMWTYMVRYNPVFDNTPKSFFATPHFGQDDIASKDPELNAVLQEMFAGKNLELFSATATAVGPILAFSFGTGGSKYTALLSATGQSAKSFSAASAALRQSASVSEADIDTSRTYRDEDIPQLDAVIETNKNIIRLTEEKRNRYTSAATKSDLSRWGYNIADTLAALTLLKHVDIPKIKTMTSFGGRLMKQNADNFMFLSEYESYTYPFKIELAQDKIAQCLMLKQNILAHGSGRTDAAFRNSYPGYLDLADVPYSSAGTVHIKGKKYKGSVSRIDGVNSIPVLLMEYSDGTDRQYMLVEFSSIIRDCRKNLSGTPFTGHIVFRMISGNGSAFSKKDIERFISGRTGTLACNGKDIRIALDQDGSRQTVFFSARGPEE